MTEQNSTIEKIFSELSKKILTAKQVSDLLSNPIEFPTELIEKISLSTALKYWNREIDFRDGDCIMNNLFTFWTTNEYHLKSYGFPNIAMECYEAFDNGEFYRENDDRSIDPSEKYTRPLIENLLRKQKKIS